jgi:hypothetical protein
VQQHARDHRIKSHGRVALLPFIKFFSQLERCIIQFFLLELWAANPLEVLFENDWLQIPDVDITQLVILHLNEFLEDFF